MVNRDKEIEFIKLIPGAKLADEVTDMVEHIDIILPDGRGMDIKGLKKIRRHDKEVNEDYHYIEINNVRGNSAWLYGNAWGFAFELEKCWIVVEKYDLQNYIDKHTIREFKDEPIRNYLYQRKGRKDLITLVKSLDLCAIARKIIMK